MQIEQFVESIFPSQDPKAIVALTNPESREEAQYPNMSVEQRKKAIAEDKEAKRDVMIMGFGVFGIMLCVCLIMVSHLLGGLAFSHYTFANFYIYFKSDLRCLAMWRPLRSGDRDPQKRQVQGANA